MVDRLYQARRERRPHRLGGACRQPWSTELSNARQMQGTHRRLARVKGGRSPAQRTLEARQPANTLVHGRMRRVFASGHEDRSGARRRTMRANGNRLGRRAKRLLAACPTQPCLRSVQHSPSSAMVDRSDQARRNAGSHIRIKQFQRSVNSRLRRLSPPAELRRRPQHSRLSQHDA
jgi:hypothetical protein